MNKLRKGMAILLCMAMSIPGLSSSAATALAAADAKSQTWQNGSAVRFNTGSYEYCVVDEAERQQLEDRFQQEYGVSVSDTDAYAGNSAAAAAALDLERYVCFDTDGRYEIQVEEDAFFPYEVQFTYDGKTQSQWFLSSEDTVIAGGHEFYLNAPASGYAMTRMNLHVGDDVVTVYPEKKTFTDKPEGKNEPASLLPLKEQSLTVDLTGYTPIELTKVAISEVFTNQEVADEDSIMWKYGFGGNNGEYKISTLKDVFLDLSVYTYHGNTAGWEMIVGEKDQLAADNIRYQVRADITPSEEWLVPTVCRDDGGREDASISMDDYYDTNSGRYLQLYFSGMQKGAYFVSFHLNNEVFAGQDGQNIKVFEGNYTEAELQNDITGKIWNADMSNAGSGYRIPIGEESSYGFADRWFTFVSYNAQGNITGCLPLQVRFYRQSYTGIAFFQLKQSQSSYSNIVYKEDNTSSEDQVHEKTYYLYKEYPANGSYIQQMDYKKNGITNLSGLSAYVGKFDSAAAAQAAINNKRN